VDVVAARPGDASSGEVPDGYSPVIAAHSQLGAPPVEGTGKSFTATVQNTFVVLRYPI